MIFIYNLYSIPAKSGTEKLAEEAIGEPVYLKTQLSKEDAIRRKEQNNSDSKEKQQEDDFLQKESATFTLCGYLDQLNPSTILPSVRFESPSS